MVSSTFSRYWRDARFPRYSLTFAFPLLVSYEVLAIALSRGEVTGVRNGADVLLKSLFITFGGRTGLTVFGALLVGGGAALIWRDYRRTGSIEPRYFAGMTLEAIVYAMAFGIVAGSLTAMLLPGMNLVGAAPPLAAGAVVGVSFSTQLMISLGAGIYEELLFRVIMVGGLAWMGFRVMNLSRAAAGLFATALGALIFAAFHYIGPYADPLELGSFTFRAIGGMLFSGLYLLRGFGITAWTHALYDVFLAVRL